MIYIFVIIVYQNVPIKQVSMLNKGFVDVGDSKGTNTGTTGSQFLEQYKTAQALAQLAAQHSQTGTPSTTPSSWDTNGTSLGQYGERSLFPVDIVVYNLFFQLG